MAITFAQQHRKQQYMLLVFAGIVLISLIVLWKGFFAAPEVAPPAPEPVKPPELKINFEVLQLPLLVELEEFPKIQPLQEATGDVKAGRENPFVPLETLETGQTAGEF